MKLIFDSSTPERITVLIAPGETVEVPDQLAARLMAATPRFKPAEKGPPPPPAAKAEPDPPKRSKRTAK